MAKDDQKEKKKKEKPKKKDKKGRIPIIFLAGGFLLSFLVICIGMYFVLKTLQPEIPPEIAEEAVTQDSTMFVDSVQSDSVNQPVVPDIDLTQYGLPEDSMITADQVKIAIAELLGDVDDANNQVTEVNKDLNEKKIAVDSLQNELQELLALEGNFDRKRINRLAKIFESMKPKEAAPVMGQLTDDINVVILMTMKERPAGKILSEMPVTRAAAISKRISQKVLES